VDTKWLSPDGTSLPSDNEQSRFCLPAGHQESKRKPVKLAPFKLRFSKMLKSRSSGDSRSNSVESEEQQRQVNQSLPSGTDEFAEADETEIDNNCLSVRSEQPIPSSPPPSYEHVLEEVNAV